MQALSLYDEPDFSNFQLRFMHIWGLKGEANDNARSFIQEIWESQYFYIGGFILWSNLRVGVWEAFRWEHAEKCRIGPVPSIDIIQRERSKHSHIPKIKLAQLSK